METNYIIIIPVLIALVVLVVYLVRRNRKDEKIFEKETMKADTRPELHKDDQVY